MRLSSVLVLFVFSVMVSMANAQIKNVYGLYEKVQLPELGNVTINAKLDTGALTSSFGATDIQYFSKNGTDWVRFKPQIKGNEFPTIEKEIVRHSKIKTRSDDVRKNEDKLHSSRPVIILDICFNGVLYPTEVNLIDRSRFNYPLLLGSAALVKYQAIVDPSLKYVSATKCKS